MGIAQAHYDVPVIKGTSGILIQSLSETISESDFSACLRCGRCVDACPMWLLPTMLAGLSRNGKYSDTKEYGLFDCKECGSCTYVCPARIPITHYIKLSKYHVLTQMRRQKEAEKGSAK